MQAFRIVGLVFILNLLLFFAFIFTHRFHPILMSFHILSLLILVVILLYKIKIVEIIRKRWQEILIMLLLVAIAFSYRLYKVEELSPGMYGDEVTVARMSLDLLKNPDWPPFVSPYSHPTPIMYMTAGSINAFGHTITAIRLPSIMFDALAVGIFFALLRLFFPLKIALLGSLLMLTAYTQIVLARLAYEPPASLFFQILTAIFLTFYWKTQSRIYLIGIAMSLGAGLYTYLNFRFFAVIVFLLTLYLIKKSVKKKYIQDMIIFASAVFISLAPLLSYILIDWHGFWIRTSEISIFSRNYPPVEFVKELLGNMYRAAAIPFIGDPNGGKNPAGTTLFDPITIVLAIIGLVFLFKKQKILFFASLIFLLPPFLSDIFSTEVIPEFHYYGLGHPNALRVSGFIPVILFLAVWGLSWIWDQWKKEKYGISIAVILVLIISAWNYHLYFNQKTVHPGFYVYNYNVNHQDVFEAIDYINTKPAKIINVTQNLNALEMTPFFIDPSKKITSFIPKSADYIVKEVKANEITVIDVTTETTPFLQKILDEALIGDGYNARLFRDPANQPRLVLFEKM